SRRRHTRFSRDWSSDVCSSDLKLTIGIESGTPKKPKSRSAVTRPTIPHASGGTPGRSGSPVQGGDETSEPSTSSASESQRTPSKDRKSVEEGKSEGRGGRRSGE